jgi:SHS2 domain-containing protein
VEKYRYVEDAITSDVMFEAYGKSFEDLLANAAEAMLNVMYEMDKVEAKKSFEMEIEAKDKEKLLYRWLSDLLAEIDVREMFFSKFDLRVDGKKLKATVHGDEIKQELIQTLIKGVTFYNFELEGNDERGYKAKVVVDV